MNVQVSFALVLRRSDVPMATRPQLRLVEPMKSLPLRNPKMRRKSLKCGKPYLWPDFLPASLKPQPISSTNMTCFSPSNSALGKSAHLNLFCRSSFLGFRQHSHDLSDSLFVLRVHFADELDDQFDTMGP